MRRRWPRLLFLVFLFLAGSYALVYGLFFHRVAFEETKQRDVMVGVTTLGEPAKPPPESGGRPAAPPREDAAGGERPRSDDVDPFRSPSAGGGHGGQFAEPLRRVRPACRIFPACG